MNRRIVLFLIINIWSTSLLDAACMCSTYTCTTDPLMQFYPNQNMCALLNTIPPALQNLSYAIYPNCDAYNTNRFDYNKRFNEFPTAIITPQTQSDLQYVFQAITHNNLPFAVRWAAIAMGQGRYLRLYY